MTTLRKDGLDRPLDGVETDNLLGFLVLLGVLRALDSSRPHWFARAYFAGVPLRARLRIDSDASDDEIAYAVAEGCSTYDSYFEFADADLKFSKQQARDIARRIIAEGDAIAAELASALCSDAAVRDDGKVMPTPLCAMFGQGHQHFLARLTTVSRGIPPRAMGKRASADDLNSPERLRKAIFERWTRGDATESFRWDFEEDRRYAMRFANPSTDAATTEHGANRLAVLGMLSFQCAPGIRNNKATLLMRGAFRTKRSTTFITWPIWKVPATLHAIHGMLDRKEISQPVPDFKYLGMFEIDQVRRVRRIVNDKFISFSRAAAIIATQPPHLKAMTEEVTPDG